MRTSPGAGGCHGARDGILGAFGRHEGCDCAEGGARHRGEKQGWARAASRTNCHLWIGRWSSAASSGVTWGRSTTAPSLPRPVRCTLAGTEDGVSTRAASGCETPPTSSTGTLDGASAYTRYGSLTHELAFIGNRSHEGPIGLLNNTTEILSRLAHGLDSIGRLTDMDSTQWTGLYTDTSTIATLSENCADKLHPLARRYFGAGLPPGRMSRNPQESATELGRRRSSQRRPQRTNDQDILTSSGPQRPRRAWRNRGRDKYCVERARTNPGRANRRGESHAEVGGVRRPAQS